MSKQSTPVNTVVVGAGHARLAMSRCLQREGISHVRVWYDDSMSSGKARVTVTIDAPLLRVAESAVADGRARSVSSWINGALEARAERERRLAAMREAIVAYESEFGEISPEELLAQQRADRRSAKAVRGPAAKRPRKRR